MSLLRYQMLGPIGIGPGACCLRRLFKQTLGSYLLEDAARPGLSRPYICNRVRFLKSVPELRIAASGWLQGTLMYLDYTRV